MSQHWVNGSNARAEEIKYYNIDQSKIDANPAGTATYLNNNGNPPYNTNPYSNATATTGYMYKTNASTNKTGLGIVLKVMAGDNINIYGVSYHKKPTGGSYTTPVSSLSVSDIINAFVGTGIMAPKGISGSTITGASGFPTNIASLIGSQPAQTADLPRASINWIVLDEQFKHVAGGFDMANGTSGSLKFHTISTIPTIPITKNGYIYVYVSNESNYDVFFDNLQVIHTPGPILEETHYYPFGLTMAGISSKAAGSLINKEKTFQDQRFDDDLGLNWVQFKWRNHDPQIGRFIEIDPLSEKYDYNSTYAFSENKVTAHVELEGLEAEPVNRTNSPTLNAFISPAVSKPLEKMAAAGKQAGSLEVSVVGGGLGINASAGAVNFNAGVAGPEAKVNFTPGGTSVEGSAASVGANFNVGKAGTGGGFTFGKVTYSGGQVTSNYVTTGGSADVTSNAGGSTQQVSSSGQISLGATVGVIGVTVAIAPVKIVEAAYNFLGALGNFVKERVKQEVPTILGGNKFVGHQ